MRYYLLKILFKTNPFEFQHIKVYAPSTAVKELKNLERWRPRYYNVLMDTKRVVWTESGNGLRNVYIRIPATAKLPPLVRMHHLFIAEVMPHLKENVENRGRNSKEG